MTALRRELAWQDDAACARHGIDADWADMFFPKGRPRNSTKEVCVDCGVRQECLAYALGGGLEGVWGGTTDEERRGMRNAHAS
jgi:WhiB family redox-sensing transcriptional regulator